VAGFVCEDDIWKDCENRAERGECEKVETANMMLAECRRTCRERYLGQPLPRIIETYGGLEDHLVDVFGFKTPICAENGGGQLESREIMLMLSSKTKEEEQKAWVPKFTEIGFEKTKIPPDVYKMLLWEYEKEIPFMYHEPFARGGINAEQIVSNEKKGQSRIQNMDRAFLTNLSPYVGNQLVEQLHPLAEEFSKVKVKPDTLTLSIRRYANGSTVFPHVDRLHKSVIKTIMNIRQDVEEDWPLYVMDNKGVEHMVMLEPGEMIWYEAARIIHSRPQPLRGDFYDNLFVSFIPLGDWYGSLYQVGKKPRSTPITVQEILNKQQD